MTMPTNPPPPARATEEPEAIECPLCLKPALRYKIGQVKLIACKCVPTDVVHMINLDTLRFGPR